jgi:enamine deaminase RidA (YjgF/YER057c/UK114 family)
MLTHLQSQAIIAGPQIYVSGQIPADKKGNLIEGSIADKTKQCCDNIVAILAEVNVGVDRIVKVCCLLPKHPGSPLSSSLQRVKEIVLGRVKDGR